MVWPHPSWLIKGSVTTLPLVTYPLTSACRKIRTFLVLCNSCFNQSRLSVQLWSKNFNAHGPALKKTLLCIVGIVRVLWSGVISQSDPLSHAALGLYFKMEASVKCVKSLITSKFGLNQLHRYKEDVLECVIWRENVCVPKDGTGRDCATRPSHQPLKANLMAHLTPYLNSIVQNSAGLSHKCDSNVMNITQISMPLWSCY